MTAHVVDEVSVLLETAAALPIIPQYTREELLQVEDKSESKTSTVSGELSSSYPSPPLSSRIALEHNYAKLVPFRSTYGNGGKDSSLSTIVLFPDRVKMMLKKRRKKQLKPVKGRTGLEGAHGITGSYPGEMSNEEGDSTLTTTMVPPVGEAESAGGGDVSSDPEFEDIDITSVEPEITLPYDERKVGSIMVECARYVNLVRVPMEISDSEALIDRAMVECDVRQQSLLKQLIGILEADKLARLAHACVPYEPIKRRLSTDKAARKFRKVLAGIQWDSKLTRWCHETLLRVLDSGLLPVYLDVLQVLKAKAPVLMEHMIHASLGMASGGEAFSLLLKRPWNPAVGLYSTEKQVKFEPAPVFISLPFSTIGLGGRRWRMWQSQLSTLGKVCPIFLPDSLMDSYHLSLHDISEHLLSHSLQRVHELCSHFVNRPVVFICFSLAGRIAAKISQLLPISMIVSLGLPSAGVNYKWKISSDPFKDCSTPSLFAVGSEAQLCSVSYTEKLRCKMKCATSLLVVGGGDDLLRLSLDDKHMEETTQSIVDRIILNEIYKFMVHILPCSFPEDQHRIIPRKRKIVHSDEISSTFLTPMSQGPVLFSPTDDTQQEGKSNSNNNNYYNLNGSSTSPFLRTFFNLKKHSGRISPTSSLSNSPSPTVLLERKLSGEVGTPLSKHPSAEILPKMGRPRSKSTASNKSKKNLCRSRSKSSEQRNNIGNGGIASQGQTGPSNSNNTFTPITFNTAVLNSNSSNNNNSMSPPAGAILTVPLAQFRPLPITPPRNPFEDLSIENRQLDPKTLRHLQWKL